jgi:hypothetical protein
MLPQGYTGPNVSLTASSDTDECVKAPATRMGGSGANIINPGPGQCGDDGNVEAGTYELTEVIAYLSFVSFAVLSL